MIWYYIATAAVSFLFGFGSGYLIFDARQADFSSIEKICGGDKICSQYTACLIVNSRETGGQNPRNCDLLVDAINFEARQNVLQKTYEFCAKQDSREAALCREFLRPK